MEAIVALIKDDLEQVEAECKHRLVSRVPLITTVAEHLVLGGGKRFRPILLLLSAKLCDYQGKDHIPLAVIIEFIHAATLLHDDVIDQAEVRRGSASANTLWGNEASVLVGDFLYTRSLDMAVQIGDLRILQTLAVATTAMAEGEAMELVRTADLAVTEEENLELIVNKTAMLISCAVRIGAILGNEREEVEAALADYGLNVGIAFQLVDDCLDYVGHKELLGKAPRSDLREGRVTLPLIHALRHCTSEERKRIQQVVLSKEFATDGWGKVLTIVNAHGGIDYTLTRAQQHVEKARRSLVNLPACPEREALMKAADYVIERRS